MFTIEAIIDVCSIVSTASATTLYPVFLFNLDQNGSTYGSACACVAKLYALDIYEGSTMVMSLRPALDGSTACLYDSISETYLYNSGSGAFTFGSDT